MSDPYETSHPDAPENNVPPPSRGKRLGGVLLALFLVAVASAAAVVLIKTKPEPKKMPPRPMEGLVQIQAVTAGVVRITVPAMGTVIPARQITLRAQVSGRVVDVHPAFQEGGLVRVGEPLLRIDPADYRLAVTQQLAQVDRAEFDWKLELGYQEVAQREWAMLRGDRPAEGPEADLALRKPHLAKAVGALAAAQAQLAQARLNLERTTIHAPFNAVLRSRQVEQGSLVSPQDALATLADTDTFWVQASLPADRLPWVAVPRNGVGAGARALVRYGDNEAARAGRAGEVITLLSDLDPNGLNARLLIAVPDPLGLAAGAEAPPLLLGAYVHVEIQGPELESCFSLPRSALRENDCVWLIDPQSRLEIRPVRVVWRDPERVMVDRGLVTGERLIVSDLPAPIPGLPLRLSGNGVAPGAPDKSPAAPAPAPAAQEARS